MSEQQLGSIKFTPYPNALPSFPNHPIQAASIAPDEGAGIKHDNNKPRTDLISSIAMEEIGKVLAHGAVKYGPNNWRKGISWGRLIGAVLRHIFAWMRGEDKDPDSGLLHLSHAITTLMMLVEFQYTRRDLDDRWRFKEE